MSDITQIQVGSNIYDIKDATARIRSIPSGGNTNQFLKKNSNTSYDASWGDIVIPEYNEATSTSSGLMSSIDKIKLDGLKSYTATTTSIGSASVSTAISADNITGWSTGTLPTLGNAITADNITSWSTGMLASATVDGENLIIDFGILPSLSYTPQTIPNVTNVGSLPSLSYTQKSIPNIAVTSKTVVTNIIEGN